MALFDKSAQISSLQALLSTTQQHLTETKNDLDKKHTVILPFYPLERNS